MHKKVALCFEWYPIVKQLVNDQSVVGPEYHGEKKPLTDFIVDDPVCRDKFVRSDTPLSRLLEYCFSTWDRTKPAFMQDNDVLDMVFRQVRDIVNPPPETDEPEWVTMWRSQADWRRRIQYRPACWKCAAAAGAGDHESEEAP